MFGGGSEGSSYGFPSAPHEFLRNQGSYVQPAPRPPSPSLVAQRLIREQQVWVLCYKWKTGQLVAI